MLTCWGISCHNTSQTPVFCPECTHEMSLITYDTWICRHCENVIEKICSFSEVQGLIRCTQGCFPPGFRNQREIRGRFPLHPCVRFCFEYFISPNLKTLYTLLFIPSAIIPSPTLKSLTIKLNIFLYRHKPNPLFYQTVNHLNNLSDTPA